MKFHLLKESGIGSVGFLGRRWSYTNPRDRMQAGDIVGRGAPRYSVIFALTGWLCCLIPEDGEVIVEPAYQGSWEPLLSLGLLAVHRNLVRVAGVTMHVGAVDAYTGVDFAFSSGAAKLIASVS